MINHPLFIRREPESGKERAVGPHGVLWTHAEQINSELVKFLA